MWTHTRSCGKSIDGNLPQWLNLPEISETFSIGAIRMVKKRLSLDEFEMHNVLEIDVWTAVKSENYHNTSKHVVNITGILCSQ